MQFYITTPIYYVNDIPHIGHAYTSIACDVMARYKRLQGSEVFFLTGTDEHGQKVQKSAEARGTDPQSFTDEVSERFRELFQALNLSNNDFIRTTESRHKEAVRALWQKLEANGYIYLDKYAGWYAMRDEAFYQESELIDGKAPTGAPVEWIEEESYFFKLSALQDKLLEFYAQNGDFVLPHSRFNEVVSFVKSGLKDLSISRTSFNWGIKVPGDEKHVIYVWLDALANYISALGYPDDISKFWPADIHMVGKDILRFHAVYWPAFLIAADLPLPKHIVAHGWWMNEGQKMSKSLGNVINPYDIINKFGLDAMRYYMLREIPFGNDGNYVYHNMIMRINSELSNNIGNLIQRSLSMIHKNCAKIIPKLRQRDDIIAKAEATVATYRAKMEECRFSEALEAVINLASEANIYIDHHAPWALRKADPQAMEQVLANLAEVIKYIAILLYPFMPEKGEKILSLLGAEEHLSLEKIEYQYIGKELPEISAVFPRFEGE